jgi:hypothetical protein
VNSFSATLPLLLTNLRLTLASNAWWYIATALILLAGAFAVYRYTLPPVSSVRRSILWTLRGVALILLVFLLFEPVLTYLMSRKQSPTIALLVDHSASVTGNAEKDSHASFLRRWLTSSAARELSARSQLREFTFADSAREANPDEIAHLTFAGVGTDIAGAIAQTEKALAGENLAAVVVVSDGAYNSGENPVRVAAESPVPLYAVGVGDTSASRDAVISQMLTNEIAYVGSTVPVELRVRARGLKGRQSILRLLGPQGHEFGRQLVQFSDDDSEQSVSLSFTTDRPGDLRIVAALDSVPGETLLDNNRRSVIVRVLENKSRVLLFSGPVTPDLTILRQTLEEDSTLQVQLFAESMGSDLLYHETSPGNEDLGKADLIILLNFPSRNTSDATLQRVAQAVTTGNVPLLFFAGPQLSAGKLQTLASSLPFSPSKQAFGEERVLLRAAAAHPALSGKTPLPREWSDLPPAVGGLGNFVVKPSAQIAVKLSRESIGLTEDEPAVALWQTGPKHGAAFFCWGLYRWRMENNAVVTASFYDQLISRVVAWLIAPVEEQRVKIRTTKRLYAGGEKVQFVGQVYGSDLAPRDDATISLRVTSGARSEVVAMRNRGNGRYEGELSPWSEGEYEFNGTASIQSDTLGSDHGLFAVEAFNIELVDTRARFDVLQAMATVSHGHFVPLSRADSLFSTLTFTPRVVSSHREIPLWNRALMIWIIIGLLAAEWIIRKRSGML